MNTQLMLRQSHAPMFGDSFVEELNVLLKVSPWPETEVVTSSTLELFFDSGGWMVGIFKYGIEPVLQKGNLLAIAVLLRSHDLDTHVSRLLYAGRSREVLPHEAAEYLADSIFTIMSAGGFGPLRTGTSVSAGVTPLVQHILAPKIAELNRIVSAKDEQ